MHGDAAVNAATFRSAENSLLVTVTLPKLSPLRLSVLSPLSSVRFKEHIPLQARQLLTHPIGCFPSVNQNTLEGGEGLEIGDTGSS